MKIHAWLYTGANKGRLITLGQWQSFQLVLLKAAGYVPHCNCGCCTFTPLPEDYDEPIPQHVWEETPAEPLVVSHNLEYAFKGHAKIGFQHCVAIADRIGELMPLAMRISGDDAALGFQIVLALRWHAQHMEDIGFVAEGDTLEVA